MNELIDHIRAAITQGATAEQKAIGAQACRTILTALDAEPGKPIAMPGVPTTNPTSRLSLDQVFDLVIARLSTVAEARDSQQAREMPRGLRIATAPMAPNHPPAASDAARQSGRKR